MWYTPFAHLCRTLCVRCCFYRYDMYRHFNIAVFPLRHLQWRHNNYVHTVASGHPMMIRRACRSPFFVSLVHHLQYPLLAEGAVLHSIEPIRCLLLLFHLLELLLVLLHAFDRGTEERCLLCVHMTFSVEISAAVPGENVLITVVCMRYTT